MLCITYISRIKKMHERGGIPNDRATVAATLDLVIDEDGGHGVLDDGI